MAQEFKAVRILEVFIPVQEPGLGEAADQAVAAPGVTPFRNMISSESSVLRISIPLVGGGYYV